MLVVPVREIEDSIRDESSLKRCPGHIQRRSGNKRLQDSQQCSEGEEGTPSAEPKLTSCDDGVDDQLGWDPDIRSKPFGDELRW